MRSVNGWTIAHIAGVTPNETMTDNAKVTLESADARLNGVDFTAVNSLKMARVGWIYALRFRHGSIIDDRILQEG
jgi:hypothetical protein